MPCISLHRGFWIALKGKKAAVKGGSWRACSQGLFSLNSLPLVSVLSLYRAISLLHVHHHSWLLSVHDRKGLASNSQSQNCRLSGQIPNLQKRAPDGSSLGRLVFASEPMSWGHWYIVGGSTGWGGHGRILRRTIIAGAWTGLHISKASPSIYL